MELNFNEIKHTLSANELRQYSECARKRYYSSRDYLAIRSTKPNASLELGTAIHRMLEYYYTQGYQKIVQGNDVESALNSLEDFIPENIENIDAVTFNCIKKCYREYFEQDLERYEIIGTEQEFNLSDWPIIGVQYHGQIDMVVIDKESGKLMFFEHKTCKDFRPEIYNRFDIQLHIYSEYGRQLAYMMDLEWGGVILNEIKKAKTERGFAVHRMYYLYDDEESLSFFKWITKKTIGVVSPNNEHEPCNNYMTCKMCDYAPICLQYGYTVPQSSKEIEEMKDEEGQVLYKYDPRDLEEDS